MWYKRDYRRHLMDMHITDWNEKFMSEFDVQTYFDNLKKAKVNNAMIYLQSHVGLCNFPTKSGEIHAAFKDKPDEVKKLIDMCRSNGISVTGYYSVIFNTVEHDKHPEWRLLGMDGKSQRGGSSDKGAELTFSSGIRSRYGLCCSSNPGYREFVKVQIKEMLDYFDLDGIFFDMLYWNSYCYCEYCEARYKKATGTSIPRRKDIHDAIKPSPSDPEALMHRRLRREWIGEFAQFVTDCVREIRPDISVQHNCAALLNGNGFMCSDAPVAYASDYVGGDLHESLFTQSYACKFFKSLSRNEPFEYMTPICHPSLRAHTMTKPYNVLLTTAMMSAAHHGAVLFIDGIDPVGTMDSRVYDRLGEVFEVYQKYEPYFKGKMAEDIGLYHSLDSLYSPNMDKNTSYSGVINSARSLVYNHVPVGVTGKFNDLNKHKVVVLPCITQEDSKDNERILEYVRNGGNLYISTAWNKELVEELLDAEVVGSTDEAFVYFAPTDADTTGILGDYTRKYPMSLEGKASVIKLKSDDCNVLATLTLPYTMTDETVFASIHSNPPGIDTDTPALVTRKYGKGKVFWSCIGLECADDELRGDVFIRIINSIIGENNKSFKSDDAPITAEITLFNHENVKYLNIINLNAGKKNIPINPFNVSVKTDKAPKSVKLLPDGQPIKFTYENGYTTFETKELKVFDMYEIAE